MSRARWSYFKTHFLVFVLLFFTPVFIFAKNSSQITPDTVDPKEIPYVLAAGNDLFVPTWYYNNPDTLLGTTKALCAPSFHPQLVLSTFGTPNSDAPGRGGCDLYGIDNGSYLKINATNYTIWGRAHLEYPGDCEDEGLYVSYVLYCMPN